MECYSSLQNINVWLLQGPKTGWEWSSLEERSSVSIHLIQRLSHFHRMNPDQPSWERGSKNARRMRTWTRSNSGLSSVQSSGLSSVPPPASHHRPCDTGATILPVLFDQRQVIFTWSTYIPLLHCQIVTILHHSPDCSWLIWAEQSTHIHVNELKFYITNV